jgi:hypothetical protein
MARLVSFATLDVRAGGANTVTLLEKSKPLLE